MEWKFQNVLLLVSCQFVVCHRHRLYIISVCITTKLAKQRKNTQLPPQKKTDLEMQTGMSTE